MARRRTAKWRYYNGDNELENIRWFPVRADGTIDTDKEGCGRIGDPAARFGTIIGAPRSPMTTWAGEITRLLGYRPVTDWHPIKREIRYLAKADPHLCDWRCTGAFPKGDCQCQCGGKNHGRTYTCD
jgi:hypothetical protein